MTTSNTASAFKPRVAVFGGGAGGLTAAQELVERGFDVDLFERRSLGGKARSERVPGTGTGGREDLPTEVGPHMLLGFYGTLPDQLRRIPGRMGASIFDEFTPMPGMRMAWQGGVADFPAGRGKKHTRMAPDAAHRPETSGLKFLRQLTIRDGWIIGSRLTRLLTSGRSRQLTELENQSVADFMRVQKLSPAAQQWMKLIDGGGIGVMNRMSARILERILTAFIGISLGRSDFPHWFLGATGPFSDVVFEPWAEHLRNLGVRIHRDHELTALEYRDGRIASVTVRDPDGVDGAVEADWYVLALPADRVAPLITDELAAADPGLARIAHIERNYLCGMTIFFTEEVPLLHDLHFSASQPWGVAAVNYSRLWGQRIEDHYGDGTVRACVSLDIPDWHTPGILYGKPAVELNPQQLLHEVLAQLRCDLPDGQNQLTEAAIHSWYLSPTLKNNGDGPVGHLEPVFVNTPSSLRNQPDAVTAIPNLFLSAAYVRTDAGLGIESMDSAAEAGRRATNGILDAAGSTAQRATIPTANELWFLKPAKALDELAYRFKRRPADRRPDRSEV